MNQKIKPIKTHQILGQWICDNVPDTKPDYRNIINLMIWFVCMQHAKSVLEDMDLKDIGSLFSDGIEPVKNVRHVQEFMDTIWDDVESEDEEETNKRLIQELKNHFGVNS